MRCVTTTHPPPIVPSPCLSLPRLHPLASSVILSFRHSLSSATSHPIVTLCSHPFSHPPTDPSSYPPYPQNLLAGNPQNARRLLSIEHTDFKAILNRWARPLAEGGDKWMYPVLGLEGSKLRELKVPAVCLFTWAHSREEDSMHTEETMTSLVDCLAGAYPMVISPDGKGNTYDAELGIWINGCVRGVGCG